MDLLVRYDYPGNVRELENVVQRGMVLARGGEITTADLPETLAGDGGSRSVADPGLGSSLPERVAALERQVIEEALAETGGNQTRAAERLGISERAVRYKLAKYRDQRD